MRVRNPSTGTVVNLDTETANAYVSAGWEKVDAAPRRSTNRATSDEASTPDAAPEPDNRTRRRRTSR